MTREQLIAKAATEVFTDGRCSLDTHFAMLGEGLDAGAIEHELVDEIGEAA